MSIIHLALMLQAVTGTGQPPLPHDWNTLPQLKHTEQPKFRARLTRFVMREQRDGRCNVPVADDGHREINVKVRSEEHTSELQSLMRISYAVFCLKKKNNTLHQSNQISLT